MIEARERAVLEEQQSFAMLYERARFELQCSEVQLHVLERYQVDGPVTLAGLDGCGRQAMYKRRLRRRHGHGRTTENTKWERTALTALPPGTTVAVPQYPAAPASVPEQYPASTTPIAPPVAAQVAPSPPSAAAAAQPPAPTPPSTPPSRVFGTVQEPVSR